jgi:hypothetical protein
VSNTAPITATHGKVAKPVLGTGPRGGETRRGGCGYRPAVKMRWRRVAIGSCAVVALWFGALVVIGWVYAGRQGERIAERVGEALQAEGEVEAAELELVHGRFVLAGLRAARADATGRLELRVAGVDCDLAPLGWALIDRECRELAVREVRLDITTLQMLRVQRPRRRPFRAAAVALDDLTLTVGAPAVQVELHHAAAGPTVFRTPLSWLFAARSVRATVRGLGPLGTIELAYDGVRWTAAGTELGSAPVVLDARLPAWDAALEPAAELAQLAELGRAVSSQLVAARLARALQP